MGRSDLALGEDPGRNLIQQRLEEVIVDPVDEGDLDRGAPRKRVANSPPNPPPTTTTRCGVPASVSDAWAAALSMLSMTMLRDRRT